MADDNKLNPFEKGVTYEALIKAIGKTKIETYLRDYTPSEIDFIKRELEIVKNKNK